MASLPCAPRGSGEVKAEDDCTQVAVELKAAPTGTLHLYQKESIFERKSTLSPDVHTSMCTNIQNSLFPL